MQDLGGFFHVMRGDGHSVWFCFRIRWETVSQRRYENVDCLPSSRTSTPFEAERCQIHATLVSVKLEAVTIILEMG